MVVNHSAKTTEDFKASVHPIVIDIMKAIRQHKPDVITASQALTEILAGCLAQVDNLQRRAKLRDLIVKCLEEVDSPESDYVDFSDRVIPN